MRRIHVLLAVVMTSISLSAVKINHDLFFQDYLNNEVHMWGPKIDKILEYEAQLTDRNMLEVSNYFYGYLAIMLDRKENKKVKAYIEVWERILDKMEEVEALKPYAYVYMSAVCTYKITLSNITAIVQGPKAMSYVDDALALAPNNPLVVGLRGNIKFYMPKGIGGDKKEALEFYKKALKLFPDKLDPLFRWNYWGLRLCEAQGYEKIDQLDKAIECCEQIEQELPEFIYIKDVYLPQLRAQKK